MADESYLEVWDIVSIALYFAIVLAVGIWATIRANRGSASGFFLAGKSMTFLPIAGSIWATNIGAQSIVGLAGSAAAFGYAPIMFEWHGTYMLIFLGWIFVPIYMASGTYTMPEYLRKRYGGQRMRVYYAIVQLFLSVLNGISSEIYAGTLFMQQLLGWNIYLSTIVILFITAIYTIGGGLAAVIYTDFLQTIILVGGATALSVIAMNQIGGYEAMTNRFLEAASSNTFLQESLHGNMSCGFPPSDSFHIFRDVNSSYPWPGLTFGLTVLATYYFCTNQTIVQRNLSAKDVSHSKAACVITSYLKILPFFFFIWPGMISRILYPNEIACSTPESCTEVCNNPAGCTNIAFTLLMLRILPTGFKGLMLAAVLAALMSSLTSQYNSSSSVFTLDIWKVLRKRASDKEQVIVGRIFGVFLIGLSIAWLPLLMIIQGGVLWDYLQAIQAYVTPPWVVVFVLGIFWRRCTEKGAWWGLMIGLLTGVARMGVHFAYAAPYCGTGDPDLRPPILTQVHYLHFAIILTGVTFIVTVCVSIVTKPRTAEQLRRVTWWTRNDEKEPELTIYEEEKEELEEEEEAEEISTTEEAKSTSRLKSCCRGVYNWLCGFSKRRDPALTKEELEEQRRIFTDISEDPLWKRVCDINAILVVALTSFIIGFYA